jgi:hypothetical protein
LSDFNILFLRKPLTGLFFLPYLCIHVFATLAQLVEQLIRNEQVIGSSPMGGSSKNPVTLFGGPGFSY